MRLKKMATAVLIACASMATAVPVVHAQAVTAQRAEFNVADGELVAAIREFSRQSRIEVIFSASELQGLRTSGVQGNMMPQEALRAIVDGSGAELLRDPSGAFLVRVAKDPGEGQVSRDDARTLGEVKVIARRVDSLSMMKRGESFLETPQAVSIMDQQRLHDQQLTTVSQVMDQTPGITVEADSFGSPTTYYARGFQITNVQVDGTSVDGAASYYFNPNLAAYEQVEVLRGADGLFAGNGDPGGTINLARKRALSVPQMLVDVTAGSWGNYSAQVDVSSPLAWDGRLRGRAVVRWHDRDFFYRPGKDSGTFFYGTVEGDIGNNTVMIVGASVEDGKQTPWRSGLPRYKDGSPLDISRNVALSADWSRWDSDGKELFLRIEHAFGDRWQMVANVTRGDSQVHSMQGTVAGYIDGMGVGIDPDNMLGSIDAAGADYDSRRMAYDLSFRGEFDLFGREHSVLVGYDRQRLDNTSSPIQSLYTDYPSGPLVDITQFDSGAIPYPDVVYTSFIGVNQTRQEGVYAKLQLQLAEPLRVILGGRYFNYDYFRPSTRYGQAGEVISTSATGYKEDGVFNPYGGVLFDLSEHWTLYGSITEIYRVQSSYLAGPLPGSTLDPMTGRNYELGTKAELRDGQLAFSAALYRIERNGEAELDASYPPSQGGALSGNCCYIALGEVVSQGVDMELTGELRPGWSFSAGYTYNDNENKRSDAVFQSLSPKHLFKLWTTYVVPGTDHRLVVGGGLTAQSSRYVSGTIQPYNSATGLYDGPSTAFAFTQGGYAVVNAMARYQIDDAWSLGLNLNNLLDRTYYRSVGSLYGFNYYGDPRSFVVSLRAKF